MPGDPSICCLGYPDVLVSENQARQILGPEVAARLTYRPDSEQILAWHRLQSSLDRVVDAESLFAALGMRFTAVDLVPSRGCERVVDLNQAVPADLVGNFDIVLDAGTMEHCFNVGQAIVNILAMARTGGFIIHLNPLSMINHGFYNFSPTYYHDFYGQNGHKLVSPIHGVSIDGIEAQPHQVQPTARQAMNPSVSMVLCVARKNHDRPPIWPMQSKYLQNPGLKAGDKSASET
ncbi:MAG: hypothetical protein ACREEP_19015 [Dongiaceae bacterium]